MVEGRANRKKTYMILIGILVVILLITMVF